MNAIASPDGTVTPPRPRRLAQMVPRASFAGPIAWVLAIMICLTTCAAAGGLASAQLTGGTRDALASDATIQIVEADRAARARQVERAQSFLAARGDIARWRVVPDSELRAIVEPWLGAGNDALPLPALIDVSFAEPVAPAELARFRTALARIAPAARIDTHAARLAPVLQAVDALRRFVIAAIAMLGAASMAAVWLAVRNAIVRARDTIEIMRLLGATNRQVASIFQRAVAIDAGIGSLAGFALGMLAILGLSRQFEAIGSDMMDRAGLGAFEWSVLALVPVAGTLAAIATARVTALLALRKLP